MEEILELLFWALVVSVVVAGIALIATAAVLWLVLSATYDRVISRGAGIGYWRWLGDRSHRMVVAWEQRDGELVDVRRDVRERTVVKLEHQTVRLSRRIKNAAQNGRAESWSTRQDRRRLDGLSATLAQEREALYGPLSPPMPHHRASETDREEAVGTLRESLEDGRLDSIEFEERIEQAYAAKTYGDLDAVVTDVVGAGSARLRGPNPPVRESVIRVSDSERQKTVDLLRSAAEEGRLDADEFSERMDRAYGAKSQADLAHLLDDLPDSYQRRAYNAV